MKSLTYRESLPVRKFALWSYPYREAFEALCPNGIVSNTCEATYPYFAVSVGLYNWRDTRTYFRFGCLTDFLRSDSEHTEAHHWFFRGSILLILSFVCELCCIKAPSFLRRINFRSTAFFVNTHGLYRKRIGEEMKHFLK